MRRFVILLLSFLITQISYGQIEDSLWQQETKRILRLLASDSLKGRGSGTPELQKAAYLIEQEFKRDSLKYFRGVHSHLQPFSLTGLSEREMEKDSFGRFLSPQILYNVIGVLPGTSLPNEAIIFSAHYDHVGEATTGADRIFNGANDNASGTTALLMLAHHYAQKRNNARTLIFCAFSGEELGLVGSKVFVDNINLDNIVAGINIEMIGNTNASGKNAFFITGASYSDLSAIFKKNLKNSGVKIVKEPNRSKMLFERSDNYSFARKGIAAHTIMCSDDNEPCYHKACDEVKRIDIPNMVNIMKAIILAASSIVDGSDTPGRIKR